MVDYHISGMAGVGMSALAQLLLDRGFRVSGSDRLWDRGRKPEPLLQLQRQGVRIYPQDGSGVEPSHALVVSSAIEPTNPEIVCAECHARPILHRAQVLAEQVRGGTLVAVAGTSGKSTTTAILGALLGGAGWNPSVINGAPVIDWNAPARVASVRKGRIDFCVAELDESDRSLLKFTPRHAILTNASEDHFSLPETLTLFHAFRRRVTGRVVDGVQTPVPIPAAFPDGWGQNFDYARRRWHLPLPGRHNLANAVQALEMALRLGADVDALIPRLAAFKGVERRLQRLASRGGVTIVDDYAHNPAKLKAAWDTVAGFSERIVALWRPHGFGPLRSMLDTLGELFPTLLRPDDLLLIAPVYDAGGVADRSIHSNRLVERLQQRNCPCRGVEDLRQAEAIMCREAFPGTTLLTLGARDPAIPELARRLALRPSAGSRPHTRPHRPPPSTA